MTQVAPTFLVRAARPADARAMPAIEQSAGELFRTVEHLAHIADGENRDEKQYRELVAGGWCLVAEDSEGALCGFLCAERHGAELHLCETGVRLERQRLGIGRRLIDMTVEAARYHRIGSITLTTFRDVAWNLPFYERLGFRRLADRNLNDRLRADLRREAAAGLHIGRRCAMRLILVPIDDGAGDDVR